MGFVDAVKDFVGFGDIDYEEEIEMEEYEEALKEYSIAAEKDPQEALYAVSIGVIYEKLDNGLEVYLIPKKDYSETCAVFTTKFGGLNNGYKVSYENEEMQVIPGSAHFLEHRIFDYKGKDILQEFSRLGAQINAYTSLDRTCYFFSTTKNFKKSLNLKIPLSVKLISDLESFSLFESIPLSKSLLLWNLSKMKTMKSMTFMKKLINKSLNWIKNSY